jgi:hypothetical protein
MAAMDMRVPTDTPFAGREALNAAFWDLGLRFQWDPATWNVLVEMESLEDQIAYYLRHWQPHLLGAYDPAFLAQIVARRLAQPGTNRFGMEAFSG